MRTRPSFPSFALAGLTIVLFLVFGYVSDLILLRHRGWMIPLDLVLAAAAGVVVFLYERQLRSVLSERLRVIRDMNSFVRNELQVLYAAIEQPDKTRISTLERSVERIDWALRELLPGTRPLEEPVATQPAEHGPASIRRSA